MSTYLLAENGQTRGPFEIHDLPAAGLDADTMVWADGMADWQAAKDVPELAGALRALLAVSQTSTAPAVPAPALPTRAPAAPAQLSVPSHQPDPTQYTGHVHAQHAPIQTVNVNVTSGGNKILVPMKSVGVSFLLTFFFGPLGMLYSTVAGGIIMLFVTIIFAIFTLGLSGLITHPICITWGCVAASSHNNRILSRV